MNRKDCLAILGMLYSDFGSEVYYEGRNKKSSLETLFDRPEFNNEILCYLRGLKLPYVFVRDILSGEYGSVFYHKIWGKNSKLLPKKYKKEDLYTSEHDGQIWFDHNGRLGVWCEVDGFVAWLDEYEKVWVVDSREEVKQKMIEMEKKFHKFLSPYINEIVDKVYSQEPKYTCEDKQIHWNENSGKIKIATIKIEGLGDYKK